MTVFSAILLLSIGIPSPSVEGPPGKAMTPEDLVELALARNPAILAEAAKVAAMEKKPSQESALPDPQFSVEWMNLRASRPDPGDAFRKGVNLGISQELPFPGVLRLKKEEAELNAVAEKEVLRRMTLSLAAEVKGICHDLQYFEKALRILSENRETLKAGIESSSRKYSTGGGIAADILKGQASLTSLDNREIELTKMRAVSMDRLDSLLGLSAGTELSIVFVDGEVGGLPALENILASASFTPSVRGAEIMKDSAAKGAAIARKMSGPEFMVGGYYRLRDMTMEGKDYFTVMAGMSIPVFNKKKKYLPAIEEAALMRESAGFEAESSLIEAKYELSENYRSAKQSADSYRLITGALIPQSRAVLQSVTASYSVGKADFESFLDSMMTLYEYETEAELMKAGFFKAIARMEGIIGIPLGSEHPGEEKGKVE